MECLRLYLTNQVPYYPQCRLSKHSNRLPISTGIDSQRKIRLKLWDDTLTSPIEVNLQSTDVADEEQLFFPPDAEEESQQEIFARKALIKQRAIEEHEKEMSTKVTEVI